MHFESKEILKKARDTRVSGTKVVYNNNNSNNDLIMPFVYL